MDKGIFKDNTEPARKQRIKSKKDMTPEEYQAVCQKMEEMRNRRKASTSNTAKPEKVREVIKYVDREKIVEKPIEVVKEVPVVKEVIKEVPVEVVKEKHILNDLLENDILTIKQMLLDLQKSKKDQPAQPIEPAKLAQPTQPAQPQRFIYAGPYNGFKAL